MLIDILDDLLYTVFKPNFECFRKVRYFAKIFVHRQEKTRYASRVPCFFVYSPAAYPPPTSSPRSQVYTQHTTSPSCSVYLEQP